MPVSLGQAISGKYAQNYDSTTPLLKGFQIGAQKRQNSEVARARKEAAQQKQNANFLKQVSGSILVKGIDDVDRAAYQEAVSGIFSEAQKLGESGDPDSYVGRMKLLGQIPIINQNFQARGKALEDMRVAYNKGELGAQDSEVFAEMQRVGDPRKLKGTPNKLFGSASITDDGMMVKSPYNKVNVNKEVDVYLGDLSKQNIGILASKYGTMYENIKGIPSDQAQLKQLFGAEYKNLQGVKTMEDLAASVWESNQNLQYTYLDNNRKDLLEKFEKDGLPINQNPKAMEYARAKFIDEQKNRAKAEMKLEGIKQVSNGRNNNYGSSFTNFGGGIISNGIRIQPSSTEENVYVIDKPNEKGKETEVLKATFFEGKDVKPFDKIDSYIRVGDDKYIVKGIYDKNPTQVFGLTRQQINTATGIGEDALAAAKIAFDADKEEALRQDYVKLRKSLGDTRDYSTLFNGDNEGQPTYKNKWKDYQSKDFPKKGTPTNTKPIAPKKGKNSTGFDPNGK
jgi:hypothetical protein